MQVRTFVHHTHTHTHGWYTSFVFGFDITNAQLCSTRQAAGGEQYPSARLCRLKQHATCCRQYNITTQTGYGLLLACIMPG